MLSVIGREVYESIIRAGPQCSLFYRRLGECKHGVVIFNRSDVVSQRPAAWLLFGFIVASQIAADLRPALTVIGRFENALCSGVQNVGVMWRKREWRYPLETMNNIGGAMTRIVQRQDADVLRFFPGLVVTIDGVFVI